VLNRPGRPALRREGLRGVDGTRSSRSYSAVRNSRVREWRTSHMRRDEGMTLEYARGMAGALVDLLATGAAHRAQSHVVHKARGDHSARRRALANLPR
jgi:hypothetical protein